jgi:hypothetical protein
MEFIPEGATVNKTCYKEIFGHLCNLIRLKRPEFWLTNNWQLLHDNAPTRYFVFVLEVFARQQVTVLSHPPHLISHHAIFFSSFHESNPM